MIPVANTCTNLRSIEFVGLPEHHIIAFFETPKVHLEVLSLCFVDDSCSLFDMLDTITAKTGALKSLKLSTIYLPKPEDFSDLIFRNKSVTHINCLYRFPNIPIYGLLTFREVADLTQLFLRAPQLRNLEIGDTRLQEHVFFDEAIENVFRAHRHRLVRVLVIRVEYLK